VANEGDPATGGATLADLRVSDTVSSALRVTTGQASIIGGHYLSPQGVAFVSEGATPVEVAVDGSEFVSEGGASILNSAVYAFGAALSIRNSTIEGRAGVGGGGLFQGIMVSKSASSFGAVVDISHSTIKAPEAIVMPDDTAPGSQVTIDASTIDGGVQYGLTSLRVGASQITGGVGGSAGTVVCAASYNGSFQALNSACQVP
jgi:hypothetical protein